MSCQTFQIACPCDDVATLVTGSIPSWSPESCDTLVTLVGAAGHEVLEQGGARDELQGKDDRGCPQKGGHGQAPQFPG